MWKFLNKDTEVLNPTPHSIYKQVIPGSYTNGFRIATFLMEPDALAFIKIWRSLINRYDKIASIMARSKSAAKIVKTLWFKYTQIGHHPTLYLNEEQKPFFHHLVILLLINSV
jgi:hypothetical protein